jgi:hypothetical protein
LARIWVPCRVLSEDKPTADYATIGSIGAYSEEAIAGLGLFLRDNGELLETIPEPGVRRYWAHNLRRVADVLDEGRSSLSGRHEASVCCGKILHYAFDERALAGLTIFKLPQNRLPIYVTEAFASRVRELGLTGFWFVKVWPLPEGSNWELLARDERRAAWKTMRKGKGSGGRAAAPAAAPRPAPSAGSTRKKAAKPVGRSLDEQEQEELRDALESCAKQMSISFGRRSGEAIRKRIDKEILTAQRDADLSEAEKLDRAFLCGVAWGESLVRDLGWHWEVLREPAGEEALAVVSEDRSLAAVVLLYAKRLVTDPSADVTGVLTFNMIKTGEFSGRPGELKIIC